jgi:hypothetical protein
MMIYLQPINSTTVTKKKHEWIGPRGVDDILLYRTPVPNIHPASRFCLMYDRRYCGRDFTRDHCRPSPNMFERCASRSVAVVCCSCVAQRERQLLLEAYRILNNACFRGAVSCRCSSRVSCSRHHARQASLPSAIPHTHLRSLSITCPTSHAPSRPMDRLPADHRAAGRRRILLDQHVGSRAPRAHAPLLHLQRHRRHRSVYS